MEYMFPPHKDIKLYEASYHAAKLCEEAGEVCEAIIKPDKTPEDVVAECMDVMQVCETIMRYYGVTDGMYYDAKLEHIKKDDDRDYYDAGSATNYMLGQAIDKVLVNYPNTISLLEDA